MAKTKWLCHLLLRLITFTTTLSATIVMATSHQETRVLALTFEAKYSQAPAFVYFVVANAIATVYGFFVLFVPSESSLWGLVLAIDMVCTIFLSSSISAAMAIAQVGKKGNSNAGWLPVCDQVPKYCNRVTGAIATDFVAVIVYVFLLFYSIHSLLDPLLLRKT